MSCFQYLCHRANKLFKKITPPTHDAPANKDVARLITLSTSGDEIDVSEPINQSLTKPSLREPINSKRQWNH